MDATKPAGRLASPLTEGLGGFFTSAMLKAAVMSELAEARAKRGYCPKCQAQQLRHVYSGSGMVYRQCAECGTLAVLAA